MGTGTRVSVDRIVTSEKEEPDVKRWAVVQWESPHTGTLVSLDVPAEWLPEDVSEGDNLVLGALIDEGETERRERKLRDMLQELMERDNSPPE